MIIECLGFVVAPPKREEFRRALISMLGPTGAEAGCVSCQLYQESSNANAFRFEAHWRSQSDLTRHMLADQYRALLVLMELSVEPPSIEFHMVSESRGLEFIQELRGASDVASGKHFEGLRK